MALNAGASAGAGKQLDLELPKLMYDPKYGRHGMKDKVEDMTPEHLATLSLRGRYTLLERCKENV